jgi:hypothetical protein
MAGYSGFLFSLTSKRSKKVYVAPLGSLLSYGLGASPFLSRRISAMMETPYMLVINSVQFRKTLPEGMKKGPHAEHEDP